MSELKVRIDEIKYIYYVDAKDEISNVFAKVLIMNEGQGIKLESTVNIMTNRILGYREIQDRVLKMFGIKDVNFTQAEKNILRTLILNVNSQIGRELDSALMQMPENPNDVLRSLNEKVNG